MLMLMLMLLEWNPWQARTKPPDLAAATTWQRDATCQFLTISTSNAKTR
jgi:hypothetical protein